MPGRTNEFRGFEEPGDSSGLSHSQFLEQRMKCDWFWDHRIACPEKRMKLDVSWQQWALSHVYIFFALSQRSTWVLRLALLNQPICQKKEIDCHGSITRFFSTVFYSMLKHGHGMYFDMRFVDGQPGECVEHSRPPKFSKRWLILLSGNLKLGEAIAAYLRSNLKYRYFTLFIWCWSSL